MRAAFAQELPQSSLRDARLPFLSPAVTSSPGAGEVVLGDGAFGIAGKFPAEVQSCLPGSYPFRLLPLVAATFPKGTAFGGSGKVSC